MTAFAASSDVAGLWRPLSAQETSTADAWLDRASALVRHQVPGVDVRATASPDFMEIVRGVVTDMVLRVMKNPDGLLEFSIDDVSGRRDAATSTGALYISDDELNLLLPVDVGLGGAFSVSLWG